jgi:hypothetical protein
MSLVKNIIGTAACVGVLAGTCVGVLAGALVGSYTITRYLTIRSRNRLHKQVPISWTMGIRSLYWQLCVLEGSLPCPICYLTNVVLTVDLLPSMVFHMSSNDVMWSCNGQC